MKKVIFLFAMVLAVTFAMAQNTAETVQTGDDNGAIVKQIGSLNDAAIFQNGDENAGVIDQNGTSNIGVVDQLDGDDNEADIDQDGSANEAYLTQGMVEEYYDTPYNISTAMSANKNEGEIIQDGLTNLVEMVQVGDENTAEVEQQGDDNVAYAYQGWPFGFWGETAITSALSSSNSKISITQLNDDNYGAVWQYGGDDNEAHISQNGFGNSSQIAQGFIYEDGAYDYTFPVYNTIGNFAFVKQVGDDNIAKLFQLGDDNSFELTQNGNNNSLGYNAANSSGLVGSRNAYFTQDGDGNTFEGVQNDGATLSHESYQFGDYNGIDMTQGEDDWAKITQDGDLNTVLLLQKGGGQIATITQMGNSNSAIVTQEP